jgi:hypothetical protein
MQSFNKQIKKRAEVAAPVVIKETAQTPDETQERTPPVPKNRAILFSVSGFHVG